MNAIKNLLELNVGFIVHQTVGFTREFPLEYDHINLPDLALNDLSGAVIVTRTTHGLLLQARLQAAVPAECVRCLEPLAQPLQVDFTELYAFSIKSVTDSGFILPENGKIDLAPLVREEMLVAVPISPLCMPDCKGLCPTCGENLNQTMCRHDEEDIDPRLESLKAFLKKS